MSGFIVAPHNLLHGTVHVAGLIATDFNLVITLKLIYSSYDTIQVMLWLFCEISFKYFKKGSICGFHSSYGPSTVLGSLLYFYRRLYYS